MPTYYRHYPSEGCTPTSISHHYILHIPGPRNYHIGNEYDLSRRTAHRLAQMGQLAIDIAAKRHPTFRQSQYAEILRQHGFKHQSPREKPRYLTYR